MRGFNSRWSLLVFVLAVAVFASACGTVATPEWAAEAQETRVALAATDAHLTAIAPTATATAAPPTETPVPATATTVPPTATAAPATATDAHAMDMGHTETTSVDAPATATDAHAMDMGHTETTSVDAPAGDPTAGQAVFQTSFTFPDGAQWACMACHSVTPDGMRLIGPGLFGVSGHADHMGPESIEGPGTGNTVYDYLHTSITNPSYFIVPVAAGEAPWALNMPTGFGDLLTEQQLNDVIAYLMSLK